MEDIAEAEIVETEDVMRHMGGAQQQQRVLSAEQHRRLKEAVGEVKWEELRAVSRDYEVPWETLISIYTQRMVHRTKQSHPHHKRKMATYWAQYQKGQTLLSIAQRAGMAPTLLVKGLLQIAGGRENLDKRGVNRILKDVALYAPDSQLRNQIMACMANDHCYSPFVDRIREHVGQEWEYQLFRRLSQRGIQFRTEDDMRADGYAKTPDVFFPIPHRVTLASGEEVVALWLDSKASFGDRETLLQGLREQMMSYRMRFGPGVIIFWFGHIDVSDDPELHSGRGIHVTDQFPLAIAPAE